MDHSVEFDMMRITSMVNRSSMILKILNLSLVREYECTKAIAYAEKIGKQSEIQNLINNEKKLISYRNYLTRELNWLKSEICSLKTSIKAQIDDMRIY
jgi:hypothetical protein